VRRIKRKSRDLLDHGVLKQGLASSQMMNRRLDDPSRAAVFRRILQLPGVAAFVMQQARIVVAFVEVFEDGGEDLRDFFRQVDTFGV